jgi:TetR/AcrR family transcriptional regulator
MTQPPSYNRELILERALSAWSDRGYDSVGMQELASSSGVTKPTIYHYFGSKAGLLEALLDRDFPALEGPFKRHGLYRGNINEHLYSLCDDWFIAVNAQPRFARLFISLEYAPIKNEAALIAASRAERITAIMRAFFEDASRDHGNMKGRSAEYAASYIGMLETYAALSMKSALRLDRDLSRKVVHQFMHGIFS